MEPILNQPISVVHSQGLRARDVFAALPLAAIRQ